MGWNQVMAKIALIVVALIVITALGLASPEIAMAQEKRKVVGFIKTAQPAENPRQTLESMLIRDGHELECANNDRGTGYYTSDDHPYRILPIVRHFSISINFDRDKIESWVIKDFSDGL